MRIFYTFIAALIIGLVAYFTYQVTYRSNEDAAISRAEQRLSIYKRAVESELTRLSHVPTTIAIHPDVVAVLEKPEGRRDFNRYLETVADAAKGSVLYVLNENGTTIAASNHNESGSFVGNNYRFRPYFKDAVEAGSAGFYAIGVTTGVPGYFVSKAIRSGERLAGVAVVKIEFQKLLDDWQSVGEDVIVTDENGIVILSSKPERAFRTTQPITAATMREMIADRKFGRTAPTALAPLTDGNEIKTRMVLEGKPTHVLSQSLEPEQWTIHYLTDLSDAHQSAWPTTIAASLMAMILAVFVLLARIRNQQTRLRAEAREAEEVRLINRKLEAEISIRRETEEQLRAAQVELIQSSRLAALGKMSAAIVHEVNQPVSAIRTFTASGGLLLDKGDTKKAKSIFDEIRTMTERLGAITSDLLIFSRKPVALRKSVDLNECVNTIAREMALELEEQDIELTLLLSPKPVTVSGSSVRFEQLVSNLLRNAKQAVEEVQGTARISVSTHGTQTDVMLIVTDNGPGVPDEIMDQLFDPFFTTKPVGHGIGLGLALCYAIADEANGKITVANSDTGGACFTVQFPISNHRQPDDPSGQIDTLHQHKEPALSDG